MKIEYFDKNISDDKSYWEYYKTINIPNNKICDIYLALKENSSDNSYGRIIITSINLFGYNSGEYNHSLDFTKNSSMLINVNDSNRFVITNIEELKDFYYFLTGKNVNSFIKSFDKDVKLAKTNHKIKNINQKSDYALLAVEFSSINMDYTALINNIVYDKTQMDLLNKRFVETLRKFKLLEDFNQEQEQK